MDLDENDNQATKTITILEPVPAWAFTPAGLSPETVSVQQGLTSLLLVRVNNTGTAPKANITLQPPPHIDWITIEPANLAVLPYQQTQGFTLTATPPLTQAAGQRVKRITPNHQATYFAGEHYQFTPGTGAASWGDYGTIFGESGSSQGRPNLVSNSVGTLYLTWVEGGQIRFATGTPTGDWDSSVVATAASPASPLVSLTPNSNEVSVAWQAWAGNNYDIQVAHRGQSGWQTETIPHTVFNEIRPALSTGPDGAVYLAWQNEDDGTIHVYRRNPASGTWSSDLIVPMANGLSQQLPVLAVDSDNNVYLAYVSGDDSDRQLLVIRRDSGNGSWGEAEEVGNFSGYVSDPPALALDTDNNLYVPWGVGYYRDDLRLKKRVATDGQWADTELINGEHYYGLDLMVDADNVPHWTNGSSSDSCYLEIFVDGQAVMDDYASCWEDGVEGAQYPTLAQGPNGTLVVVWQMHPAGGGNPRLYLDVYQPQPSITKNYSANGRQIATRVDGALRLRTCMAIT